MSTLAGLDPRLRPFAEYLLDAARNSGAPAIVTSVRRSRAAQQRLYNEFLAGRAAYPVAPPGRSKHERGLAFDVSAPPDWLEAMGHFWEAMGGRWGGRFSRPDPIHFEAPWT